MRWRGWMRDSAFSMAMTTRSRAYHALTQTLPPPPSLPFPFHLFHPHEQKIKNKNKIYTYIKSFGMRKGRRCIYSTRASGHLWSCCVCCGPASWQRTSSNGLRWRPIANHQKPLIFFDLYSRFCFCSRRRRNIFLLFWLLLFVECRTLCTRSSFLLYMQISSWIYTYFCLGGVFMILSLSLSLYSTRHTNRRVIGALAKGKTCVSFTTAAWMQVVPLPALLFSSFVLLFSSLLSFLTLFPQLVFHFFSYDGRAEVWWS